MAFLLLLEVASMPILEVLIISSLGTFIGTKSFNLLPSDARKSLNKIVFMVFTPSLMFASLAKTVTLEDVISWWFMPINIGLTYLFGGTLGWILVKILKPEPYLEGLVIAMSSSGNLGNLLLIIIHATCRERGSPFGDQHATVAIFFCGFYMWSYTFHLIRTSAVKYEAYRDLVEKTPNKDFDDSEEASFLKGENRRQDAPIVFSTSRSFKQDQERPCYIRSQNSIKLEELQDISIRDKLKGILLEIVEEVKAPPTIAAIAGLTFGGVKCLKNLIIGDEAPLRVIQGAVELLGYVPDFGASFICHLLRMNDDTLLQGRNHSLHYSNTRRKFDPRNTIFRVESSSNCPSGDGGECTMPPGMNIGTMTQLVDVGQAECSVLFLWTYVVAALALAVWSTVYMWILSRGS
ncbi:hypothetical protein QQ045_011162 [Rhodiola kirilowii]